MASSEEAPKQASSTDGTHRRAEHAGQLRPRPALLAMAVGAGLLAAGALAGLDARSPRSPEQPPQRAQAQGTATAAAGSTEPLPGAAVSCNIVGRLETVDVESGELWGRLQNTGAVDAAPGALELGWTGEAQLRQVVVRDASGSEIVLHEGLLDSPAMVTLPDAPSLAPGAALELGLRFEVADAGKPWVPGPVVVHLLEDCRTVLAPLPSSPPCDIEVLEGPHPATGNRETVELSFRGIRDVGQPRRLIAIEVSWPVDANGALTSVEFNGRNRLQLEQPLTKSPATVPLDRLLGRGLLFVDGERITVGLGFEKAVAGGPYVVTLATDGCARTTTTWLDTPRCSLTARDFRFEEGTAHLQLQNGRAFPVGLSSLALFWPDAINGALVEVQLDGKSVWVGEAARSPASLTLSDEAVLAARAGSELGLRFAGAPPEGSAGGAGAIARAAYTLIIETKGGCRTVFSERASLDACSMSSGPPVAVAERKAMRFDLSNNGGDARLRELALAWNPSNGALTGVTIGGRALLAQPVPYSTLPLTLPLTADLQPLLSRNSRQELWLSFENEPASDGYLVQLSFDNASGEPCQDLLISRPLVQRPLDDCPFSLTNVRVQDLDVLATLRSLDATRGGTLIGLNVDWPAEQRLRPLTEVALLDGNGQPTVLWSGTRLSPPLAVDLAKVSLLPSTEYTLRLRFAGLLGTIDDPGAVFRIVLELADGCQIVDRAEGTAPPKRELLEGVLLAPLPQPLLSCCWRVQRSGTDAVEGRNAVMLVEADQRTRIEPDAVTPRPGDVVSIDALSDGSDRYYAERIRFIRHRPPERLVGTIDKIAEDRDPGSGMPTWISVHGRRVLIVDTTRVEGVPITGAVAIVEGERNPDGSLTATSIQVAGGRQAREFIEIEGIVQRAERATDVQLPDLRQTWWVGRYNVRVMLGTVVSGGVAPQPGQDPDPPARGTVVRVYGTTAPESSNTGGRITIDAQEIEFFTPPASRTVKGVITALPQGSLIGTWQVKTKNESGQDEVLSFEVTSLAVVNTRLAPAEAGLWVRARLEPRGADRWQALDVETDWEE
jgi:hypothetical protein